MMAINKFRIRLSQGYGRRGTYATFCLGVMLFTFTTMALGKIAPGSLRCEYMDNPKVVGSLSPRLSWINEAV